MENIAKRGSDEIGSVQLKFIENYKGHGKDELIIFTDNCGGQNKNWSIVSLWLQLLREKRYSVIQHRFLVSSHTHLPSDRDFTSIEKKRKYLKQIYHPQQWYEAKRNA